MTEESERERRPGVPVFRVLHQQPLATALTEEASPRQAVDSLRRIVPALTTGLGSLT